MAKIKVSEATGAVLDYMVAKANNHTISYDGIGYWIVGPGLCKLIGPQWNSGGRNYGWSPSTNGNDAVPIIEREKITLTYDAEDQTYSAHIAAFRQKGQSLKTRWKQGPTALIAAMRCHVAAELGDEVEVPDELIGA